MIRTLLALVFCVSMAQGQTDGVTLEYPRWLDDDTTFTKILDSAEVLTARSFVTLWDRYAERCYADSSWWVPPIWMDDVSFWPPDENLKPHWTHREPTFHGFVEYIRKQEKE